jgi:uncharacterized protein DUF6931
LSVRLEFNGPSMSLIRFATARSLFEVFPELADRVTTKPTDEPPVSFLKKLHAGGRFDEAVSFCAFLLPRRESVWWGCGSVRSFLRDSFPAQPAALIAAETWVSAPDDQNRRTALEAGSCSDDDSPLTWLARAAGWSGGMLSSHPKGQVPVPHYMTPRAVRIAILLGAARATADREAIQRDCIASGVRIAETGI